MPFVTANSKRLFYTINRPVETAKTILVFVHGLGSSSCFYQTLIPNLSADNCAIALDTYGSGMSKLTDGGASEQSVASITKDVAGLLEALEVREKVVVVGHSMGGIIASSFAAAHPNAVQGVVLIGPVNPGPAMAEIFEKRIQVVQKDGLEALAETVPTSATGSASTALHHAFIRALILGTSPEGYASLCKVIATAAPPDYQSIKVPLLILAGANDKTAPLAGSQAILDSYGTPESEKQIEILQGVGHWHCIENPDMVKVHLSRFLKTVTR
ncbi:hypothetical protein BP5796_01357 [Coleophoma crateriformis]|uniref:Serine aminopeptidase S33 domain-containing protein n=1 Tax=Coleophoma crateriformis TaxID=565419 RepID=A0A3D8T068_9HELO|nr:hypothetical protein BP5796_01357 [Coleophoma crateriformis]